MPIDATVVQGSIVFDNGKIIAYYNSETENGVFGNILVKRERDRKYSFRKQSSVGLYVAPLAAVGCVGRTIVG